MSEISTYFMGWIESGDDGRLNVIVSDRKHGPEVISEYYEITKIVVDLRPFVIDYLSLEQNFADILRTIKEIKSDFELNPHNITQSGLQGIKSTSKSQRCLTNFLTSAGAFRDRSEQRIREVHGKESDVFQQFRTWQSELYDASFAYRVMHNLRNYATHHSIPVSVIKSKGARSAPDQAMEFEIGIILRVSDLLSSEYLQKKVREELAKTPLAEHDLIELAHGAMLCYAVLFKRFLALHADKMSTLRDYFVAARSAPQVPDTATPFFIPSDAFKTGEEGSSISSPQFLPIPLDEWAVITRIFQRLPSSIV